MTKKLPLFQEIGYPTLKEAVNIGDSWRGASPAYSPPPPYREIAKGIRVILDARNGGRLSEQQADDLIKVLLGSYMGMVIGYQVSDYLERSLSLMMQSQVKG